MLKKVIKFSFYFWLVVFSLSCALAWFWAAWCLSGGLFFGGLRYLYGPENPSDGFMYNFFMMTLMGLPLIFFAWVDDVINPDCEDDE